MIGVRFLPKFRRRICEGLWKSAKVGGFGFGAKTNETMESLAHLLGGSWPSDPDPGKVLTHLSETLCGLMAEALNLDFTGGSMRKVSILGPYLARGILEVGFSMLLARLDPFRLRILRQIQQSPEYEIERRNDCALQWKGDFLPAERVKVLWDPEKKPKDMTRALLGNYNDYALWRPALANFLTQYRTVGEARGWQI